jgi:hypothetical protein
MEDVESAMFMLQSIEAGIDDWSNADSVSV